MSGHSSGPWEAIEVDEECWTVVFNSGNSNVVWLDRRNDGNSDYAARSGPDARLIAAAPDLLEAVKVLYAQAELFNDPDDRQWNDVRTLALAAIAKAETK